MTSAVDRAASRSCASRQRGQAAVEVLLLTMVLIAGFWGVGWMQGDSGVLAMLLDALRGWHQRFAATLALPV